MKRFTAWNQVVPTVQLPDGTLYKRSGDGSEWLPIGNINDGISFTCALDPAINVGKILDRSDLSFGYAKHDIDLTFDLCICTLFEPEKIIFSGPKCVVIWKDGTKTIVSLKEGEEFDPYTAFCYAACKKIFGSTTMVKKIVDRKSVDKRDRIKKEEEQK